MIDEITAVAVEVAGGGRGATRAGPGWIADCGEWSPSWP